MCCRCNCEQHRHEEGQEEYGLSQARHFLTKAEKVEKLKKYADGLRKELTAIEEHITELES